MENLICLEDVENYYILNFGLLRVKVGKKETAKEATHSAWRWTIDLRDSNVMASWGFNEPRKM